MTLQPALVMRSVKLPSIMLLLLHCMLEHVESASGAGTQNRLQRASGKGRSETRHGWSCRARMRQRRDWGRDDAYSRFPGPQLHCTQRLAVTAYVPLATARPASDANAGNDEAHAATVSEEEHMQMSVSDQLCNVTVLFCSSVIIIISVLRE